jgi:hypothetical protein
MSSKKTIVLSKRLAILSIGKTIAVFIFDSRTKVLNMDEEKGLYRFNLMTNENFNKCVGVYRDADSKWILDDLLCFDEHRQKNNNFNFKELDANFGKKTKAAMAQV